MAPAWIVQAVDGLKYGCLGLAPIWPVLAPEHFCLQTFEERLDRSVVIAVALGGHGWDRLVRLQLLLEVVGTISAAAIGMENAVLWGSAQVDEDRAGIALALRWSSPATALRYGRKLAVRSNAAARVLGDIRK